MSTKRRVKGWWVICLMAGLGAQPLCAAEAGAVSRAVEVAPPQGWTPDTPLFHEEVSAPGREAAQAPNPIRAEPRARAAAGKGTSPKEARVVKAKRGARASAQAARSAKAGKSVGTTRVVVAKRGTERGAERRGDRVGGRVGGRVSGRAASARRHASVAQTAVSPVARAAKAKRAEAAARKKATRAGTRQALVGKPLKARQVARPRPGRVAKGQAKAHSATGRRAASPGVNAPGPAATASPSLR